MTIDAVIIGAEGGARPDHWLSIPASSTRAQRGKLAQRWRRRVGFAALLTRTDDRLPDSNTKGGTLRLHVRP